jgi:hypothetical protein
MALTLCPMMLVVASQHVCIHSNAPSPFQPARSAPESELAGPHGLVTAMDPTVEMEPLEHGPFRHLSHLMGLP